MCFQMSSFTQERSSDQPRGQDEENPQPEGLYPRHTAHSQRHHVIQQRGCVVDLLTVMT